MSLQKMKWIKCESVACVWIVLKIYCWFVVVVVVGVLVMYGLFLFMFCIYFYVEYGRI